MARIRLSRFETTVCISRVDTVFRIPYNVVKRKLVSRIHASVSGERTRARSKALLSLLEARRIRLAVGEAAIAATGRTKGGTSTTRSARTGPSGPY